MIEDAPTTTRILITQTLTSNGTVLMKSAENGISTEEALAGASRLIAQALLMAEGVCQAEGFSPEKTKRLMLSLLETAIGLSADPGQSTFFLQDLHRKENLP